MNFKGNKGIKFLYPGSTPFCYICPMKILLVDNYDSFTWNIFHYLEMLSDEVVVLRNDDPRCLETESYNGIVISPGPGLPAASGFTMEVIRRNDGRKPMLGVCLGHQAIVEYYGGRLMNLERVLHGKSRITHVLAQDTPLFKGMPANLQTGHYHSWVADPQYWPDALEVTASDMDGLVMACQHASLPVAGVQFHPESVLTPEGMQIIRNWIGVCHNFTPRSALQKNCSESH